MARRLKILLTGSNGYLGKYFINYFGNKKNYEITKFTRTAIESLLRNYKNKNFKEINFYKKKFDVLIHIAAMPHQECEKYPNQANIINNLLTQILSEYCIENNCCFIFFSSVQVYGNILKGIYSEESSIKPINEYSISKAKAEENLLKKFSSKSLKGIILRIGNIVGLPQSKNCSGWQLFANNVIKSAFFKNEILIKNNPNLRRNFLDINLLMKLIEKILYDFFKINNNIPNIINVTNGESITLLDYSKIVSEIYKDVFQKEISILYSDVNLTDIPYSVIKNNILRNYLSYNNDLILDKSIINIIKFLEFQ